MSHSGSTLKEKLSRSPASPEGESLGKQAIESVQHNGDSLLSSEPSDQVKTPAIDNTEGSMNESRSTVEQRDVEQRDVVRPPRLMLIAGGLVVVAVAATIWQRSQDGTGIKLPSQPTDLIAGPTSDRDAGARSGPLAVSVVCAGSVAGADLSQRFAGLLVPDRESSLGFERGGRVVTILVNEGTAVTTGQLLAELDQEDLDARESRIRSELAAESATLDELEAGPRQQTLDGAKSLVDELEARTKLADLELGRQRRLVAQRAGSSSELDAAEANWEATRSRLAAAKASLAELNEGTRGEQLAAQRAKCAATEASLKEVESARNDSKIVAPFDGVISSRSVDEGSVVSPGNAVLGLVSTELEAQIGLPPDVAAGIQPGTRVKVHLRGRTRSGVIDRAEPTVRRDTRTRVIYTQLFDAESGEDPEDLFSDMKQSGWVAGEVVELELPSRDLTGTRAGTDTDRYWLPAAALDRGAHGLWTVIVLPGQSEMAIGERRAVELLKTDGALVLVQGMIQSGERVVSSGLHRITHGMLLKPFAAVSETPEVSLP